MLSCYEQNINSSTLTSFRNSEIPVLYTNSTHIRGMPPYAAEEAVAFPILKLPYYKIYFAFCQSSPCPPLTLQPSTVPLLAANL